MDERLRYALLNCETDLEGALYRLGDDEDLYVQCLDSFLRDPTMDQLGRAIAAQSWDEAFTAAHALKGVAGNMGFIPIFHAVGETVVLIRKGRISEIGSSYRVLQRYYMELMEAIQRNLPSGGKKA